MYLKIFTLPKLYSTINEYKGGEYKNSEYNTIKGVCLERLYNNENRRIFDYL